MHQDSSVMLWDAFDRLMQELTRVERVPRKQVEDRIRTCLRWKRRARAVSAIVK